MTRYLTRYGYDSEVADENSKKITSQLIEELRTEEFEEPDDEHTQVSISNAHWSVTAQVSGLIVFENFDVIDGKASDLPEKMFMRNIEDCDLVSVWQAVIGSDSGKLMSFNWWNFDKLLEYLSDFYR